MFSSHPPFGPPELFDKTSVPMDIRYSYHVAFMTAEPPLNCPMRKPAFVITLLASVAADVEPLETPF